LRVPFNTSADASTPTADGAWTGETETVLAVLTADCLPVVLSDRDGSRLSIVHAGWKGLASGILQNALELFTDFHDVHAWLGPAIGPTIFEVGEDVLDIYGLARATLCENRKVTVTGGEYCTHTQAKWFHSYRRDGVSSGRMATMAWISKA